MTKQEIYDLMRSNPVFYLATADGDQPRVRGMLLFKADEEGIVFHTASTKDVFKQIMNNPKAEMCFSGNGVQVRVTGVLKQVFDMELRKEIFAHPSRKFLQAWVSNGIDNLLQVFRLTNCEAVVWTMATNFDKKEIIKL